MITIRQIQRLWDAGRVTELVRELTSARIESAPTLRVRLNDSIAAAALALIRLDEFNQSHVPLARTLIRHLIASQGSEGGWDDPLLCALCVRALQTSRGHGLAVQRGLAYLANLQKAEGIWPAESLRRMPADPLVSAFILLQLGGNASFAQSVRLDDALGWFEAHSDTLDAETRTLWEHASLRSRARRRLSPCWS